MDLRANGGGVYTYASHSKPQKIQRVKFCPALAFFPSSYIITCMQSIPLQPTKWNDRLAFDVALTLENSGETLQGVMERYDLTADDILALRADPVFLKKVDEYRGEIRNKGLTFKLKARAQAEELLTTSWLLIHDPAVSPAVKADLIKSTVKWAGLEPKNDPGAETPNNNVKITINLGTDAKDTRTIEAPVIRQEQDPDLGLEPDGFLLI